MRRRRGYTRLSRKNQVTIPEVVVDAVRVRPGDEFRVDAGDEGTIVLTPAKSLAERRREAIRGWSGHFEGLYPPEHLERLRDEWER